MLYILEGCDGAGKTTLAQQLSKLLDAEIIHCSTTTPNTYAFFANIAEKACKKNIIADRFCYGQFIYQEEDDRPIRGYDDNSIQALGRFESRWLLTNAKVILVTAPTDIIKERLALRGEILINGLTVKEIKARYAAIRKMSILSWIDWCTGGDE